VASIWNVPQHDEALHALNAALDEPHHRGAVVLGPDGSGKSALTRAAAEHYANAHPAVRVCRATGTPTESTIPFGAFGHLVEVADIGKPAALLRTARESLQADLLIVDDAHHLDALSSTLVYQLASTGRIMMLVTARADTAPPAIRAIWDDGLLPRVDICADATDPAAAQRFVAGLPGLTREVLDLLGMQEPIALADLQALTSPAAVRDAERRGAVERFDRDGTEFVYTAHPLFAEIARSGADGHRLRGRLLPPATARCRNHIADRLRIADLAVDSDAPQPIPTVLAAAGEALRLGDLLLAERLSSSVLRREDVLDARLILGQALAWQGRGREADAVLSAADAADMTGAELISWALPRAANQFWMLSRPEQATAFLQSTRGRLTEPTAILTVDALAATFSMNAGNPFRARQLANEILTSPDAPEVAVAWAASTASLCAARMGQFADVAALVSRALATEHPGLLRFTVGLAQITALLMDADIAGARTVAEQYTDFAELQQPGRAIGEVLVARVLLEDSDFDAAADLLGPASVVLDRTGYSWGPLALTLRATALARLGKLAESAKVLARAESRHGTKSALFTPELGLARAWRLSAGRDSHGAIVAARQAAAMAERSGQFTVAVLCWRDADLLGDTRARSALEVAAAQADCKLSRRAAIQAMR